MKNESFKENPISHLLIKNKPHGYIQKNYLGGPTITYYGNVTLADTKDDKYLQSIKNSYPENGS